MIPRSVYLGEQVEASATFFENGQPVQSKDPTQYPLAVVKDAEGNLVYASVSTFFPMDNSYHVTFEIPDNAILSTDEFKYSIEWELVSTLGKSYRLTEFFDVWHPSYNLTSSKEQQKLVLPFVPMELSVPLPGKPLEIKLTIYNDSNAVISTINPVNKGIYSGYYIYTANIPANTFKENKFYAAVWSFTLGNEESVFYQKIQCADLWAMSKISDMRMYLDKVMKDIDTYVGWRDSDLYFHLQQGLNHLNILWLPTDWTFISMKGTLSFMFNGMLTCALYSALRAQYLAEGDSAFSYSGQPVTLEIDRTGFIEAELGRLQDLIENQIKPAKIQAIKRMRNGGHLNLTYPSVSGTMGSMNPNQMMSRGNSYR